MDTCKEEEGDQRKIVIKDGKGKKRLVFPMEKGSGVLGVKSPKRDHDHHRQKRRRKKNLSRLILDYLKSDSYMYAPLIDTLSESPKISASPVSSRHAGFFRRIEIERSSILTERKLAAANGTKLK